MKQCAYFLGSKHTKHTKYIKRTHQTGGISVKSLKHYSLGIILVAVAALSISAAQRASAEQVPATLQNDTVKVGKLLKIQADADGVQYKYASSNTAIASVSADGRIVGKKAGKATITVEADGYTNTAFTVAVSANGKYKELGAADTDMVLTSEAVKGTADTGYTYSARIKNTSANLVNRVVYKYSITTASGTKKDVELESAKIKAGATSKLLSCECDRGGTIESMTPKEISVTSKGIVYTYYPSSKKISLKAVDTAGPVFSGFVGKQSIYNKEPVMTVYSDWKSSYDFTKYVTAKDKKDGKVKVKADTGKINWKKTGRYKVYYTATDKSGNETRTYAWVQMIVKGEPERVADIVLSAKTKSSWSDEKKLRAIYSYTSKSCSYTGTGSHKDWRNTGLRGIRNHYGDCFTYYSTAKLLISRAGIPNLTITREPAVAGHHHWWNLCYVRNGWYHLDTTPRRRRGYFCLQTDAQLHLYSTGSTFRFAVSKYPKRATKKISRNPI